MYSRENKFGGICCQILKVIVFAGEAFFEWMAQDYINHIFT
jgi:hypothetical protein